MLDFEKYREKMPEHIFEAVLNYVIYGYHPGSFLAAVFRNDLKSCVDYGDHDCLDSLADIVRMMVNEAPGDCWGNPARFEEWLSRMAKHNLYPYIVG